MSTSYLQSASDPVSQSSAGSLAKAFTNTTCQRCRKRPVEYRLNGRESFQVSIRCGDRPRVTKSVRLEPGAFCDDCVVMALQKKCDLLHEYEWVRWLSRQEFNRRQANNMQAICSLCRRGADELVYLPDEGGLAGYCMGCLYVERRNRAFRIAVAAPTGSARAAAVVGAIEEARQQARGLFQYVWG